MMQKQSFQYAEKTSLRPPETHVSAAGRFIRMRGFTLIEVLIVVTLVAILSALAYPAYTAQVIKARRGAAQEDLLALAEYMERVYTENKTYKPGGNSPGLPFAQSPSDSGNKYYNLSFASISDTAYVLQALPIAISPQNGDGKLTFSNTGDKCWDKDNDDSCAVDELWN